MRKICYIHIGMPKTGTTSIQNNFYKQREEIEKAGLYYYRAHIDGEDAPENIFKTISLALRYKKPDLKIHSFEYLELQVDPSEDEKHFHHLDHILKTQDKIFMSSEMFFHETKEHLTLLKDLLQEYGFAIKVIIYVRNPYSFIASNGQQALKTGLSNLSTLFLATPLKKSIAFWQDNLEIRRFEREFLYKGNLLDDICHWLGFDQIRPLMKDDRHNDSINQNACTIAYLMQKNNIFPHKKPSETIDTLYANALIHISRVSPSQDKFLFPKKLLEDNIPLQKEINDYIHILREYFNENVYEEKILGDYDIDNLSSINERELLIILQNLGRENQQLREKIYNQKTKKKITFQEAVKAVLSKRRRERLIRIRK